MFFNLHYKIDVLVKKLSKFFMGEGSTINTDSESSAELVANTLPGILKALEKTISNDFLIANLKNRKIYIIPRNHIRFEIDCTLNYTAAFFIYDIALKKKFQIILNGPHIDSYIGARISGAINDVVGNIDGNSESTLVEVQELPFNQ